MSAANPVTIGTDSASKLHASRVLLIGRASTGRDPQIGKALEAALGARNCRFRYAAGSADCFRLLRQARYDVVITDPATDIEEDLALLSHLRVIQPAVRIIVLTHETTPEDIIAALRARVFLVKSAPFDAEEIAEYALRAGTTADSLLGIEVLSAHRDWVTLRMNCQMLTAERLVEFLKELQTSLPEGPRETLMLAFREILMNAIEHGAAFHPSKVIEVAAVLRNAQLCFTCETQVQDSTGMRFRMPQSRIPQTRRSRISNYAKPQVCVRAVSAFSPQRRS